jgi:hypothetical protein
MRRNLVWSLRFAVVMTAFAAVTIPSLSHAAEVTLSDKDRQAAYCMQALFGMAQTNSAQLAAMRQSRGQAQSALQSSPPADKRAAIEAAVKSLEAQITTNEAKLNQRQRELNSVINYLQRRGLMNGDGLIRVSTIGEQATTDARDFRASYDVCWSRCAVSDFACHASCSTSASSTPGTQRLLSCAEFAQALP